jgi:hypothetical protein
MWHSRNSTWKIWVPVVGAIVVEVVDVLVEVEVDVLVDVEVDVVGGVPHLTDVTSCTWWSPESVQVASIHTPEVCPVRRAVADEMSTETSDVFLSTVTSLTTHTYATVTTMCTGTPLAGKFEK